MSNWLEDIHWIAINDDIIPMGEIKRIQQVLNGNTYRLIVDTPIKRYTLDPDSPGFRVLNHLWTRIQQYYFS